MKKKVVHIKPPLTDADREEILILTRGWGWRHARAKRYPKTGKRVDASDALNSLAKAFHMEHVTFTKGRINGN